MFAGAPELGKKALENALHELRSQASELPPAIESAGRTGASYEINWRVDRIRDGDIVLIREDPANPDVPSATRVIPLRPEGSDVLETGK